MKVLLRCIKKASSYTFYDIILILKIFILTGIFRMMMLYVPFKKLKKYLGELNEESSENLSEMQYRQAIRISWAIEKVVKHTPWQSKCLVQSLTAQYLLYHKGISSTLYLGLSNNKYNNNEEKSGYIAHSWIRCGQTYVTGGDGAGFAIVARFRKGI